ncbi:VanZ family protein [Anaerosacchariphilus polymeriproducens]|uniref:VanZ family protein n=1 Tax=Anaerosacchariphilus polymeriproducens TaxID=1812858 RepID=A0A371AVP6_9FIRM|nr:VanZ family protein [Anaerosacchariphilus polymeriproducens]RDU23664.1 VanZ family protein [Anaerosacchariphilus polymeriproducens]
MRISDLISLGKQYLLLGIVLAVVLAVFILITYSIIYKKILKGKKRITRGAMLWITVFICYLVVVTGVTMLSRGSWYDNAKVQPLFYSYKEAWNSFSLGEWRNIILNILLFVPFGFLLPLGIKWFQKFWKICLAGFLFTLLIETSQLLLKRGIFEVDDLFDNTIGTMIGYGCFAMVLLVTSLIKREKKYVKRTIALQLPLIIAIVSFVTIFVIYANQELGNLKTSCIAKVDRDKLAVKADVKYSTDQEKLTVYKIKQLSQEETYQFAVEFFNSIRDAIDESRNDIYDETAVYYSIGGYSLWINYLGGTYSFTDYNTELAKTTIKKVNNATEEVIKSVLEQYGIKLPEGIVFSNDEDGNYTFTAKELLIDGTMYDGTLSCKYYENGKVGSIRWNILKCEPYKDFTVISEEDAYKKILEGKFNNTFESNELNIRIGQAAIQYMPDSKGYYQPVYVFEADINGDSTELFVPAI